MNVIKYADNNQPQLPELEYTWTSSNVDIIATNESIDQLVKELTFFFKKLDIKNIDESTTTKLIKAGFDTIEKILLIKPIDLLNIDGFGKILIDKIYC